MNKNFPSLLGGLLAAIWMLAGCAPAQAAPAEAGEGEPRVEVINTYAAREGDSALERGTVILEGVKWNADAGTLTFSGSLPTPCQELRIDASQSGRELAFTVYSLSQPDMLCAQVLEPFEAILELKNFSADAFSVKVNDEIVDLQ
jgi:hypothetical protein